MKNKMMKRTLANKVVDVAIQTSKMSNQKVCAVLLGKPKSKFDLTSDDYESLAMFMKAR